MKTSSTSDSGRGGDTPSVVALVGKGILVGVVGSLVVAAMQGAADIVLGRPLLHTPGVLGLGMVGMPGVVAADSDVIRFTVVHVLVFAVVGAMLALASSRPRPGHSYRWLIALVFLGVFFGGATMAEAWDPYHHALPNWSIVTCNVVALAVMGWLLRPGGAPGTR